MVKPKNAAAAPTLTPEEFVLKAIRTLKTDRYKGVHVRYSGFNTAFRRYFGDKADPIETTTKLRKERKIAILLARGGATLYLREDLKETTLDRHDADWERRDNEDPQKKTNSKSATEVDNVLAKILKG